MTLLLRSLPWLLSLLLGAMMMASHCPARAGSVPAGLDLGSEPVTMTVKMEPSVRSKVGRAEGISRLVIEATRIEAPSEAKLLGFRLFLGLPTANKETSSEDPHFLGSVAFGQQNAKDQAAPLERFSLRLEKTLEALGGLSELGDLEVTMVPEFHPGATPPDESGTYARLESIRVTAGRE